MKLWKVCFHSKKGMEKGKHIMPGSPFQKGKYREVTMGIGCHIHVEMVTEEIAFPVGIPAPVTVRLGVMPFAIAGSTAFFFTLADPLFPLLCSSADRSAVPRKGHMIRIDQTLRTRDREELLVIKPENKEKRILWF